MRRPIYRILGSTVVSAGLLFWAGCGLNGEHAGCDHDHDHAHADDGHSHIGPNGGRLIVLGDEDYHAEIILNHATGEVIVSILDHTGRNPVGIAQRTITLNFKCEDRPHQIQLASADCPEGASCKSSRFCGTSDLLRGKCELTGRLNLVISGKPYTGRVAHHESDHQLIR